MMQAAVPESTLTETVPPRTLVIQIEWVIYLALILFSLVMRVAELDTVALRDSEARQALASWRVLHPNPTAATITPESPLLFWLNNLSFTLLGGSEMAARLWTAIAGVALAVSPVLFRGLLGRTRALVLSVLLTLSPVLLVSSRFSSPAIWSSLLAVLGLWTLWRYWETRRPRYAVMTTMFMAAAAIFADPGGVILGVIIALGGGIALWLSALDAPDKLDIPGNDFLEMIRARFAGWPWMVSFVVTLLALAAVGTGFMLYPAGLSAVGELLGAAVRGITTPVPGAPAAYPLAVSLFYEPFLWVFAIIAIWLLVRRGEFSFIEWFFAAWTVIGILVSLLYAGGRPDHALWLILPVAGLASYSAAALLQDDDSMGMWGIRLPDDPAGFMTRWSIPRWAKWLLAGLMLFLLAAIAVHLQLVGRALQTLPQGLGLREFFDLIFTQQYVAFLRSTIWLLLSAVFIIVGYFLAASIWGSMTAAQGGALGVLCFALLSSAGSGWNAAVPNSSSPVEFWNFRASSGESFLLRQTLSELTDHESGGFTFMPLTVVGHDDGLLAWMVRDYANTRFVRDVRDARNDKIVLLDTAYLVSSDDKPDLGNSYVGQRFVMTRTWPSQLRLNDVLVWWLQREALAPPVAASVVILWVRQDVYDGTQLQVGGG